MLIIMCVTEKPKRRPLLFPSLQAVAEGGIEEDNHQCETRVPPVFSNIKKTVKDRQIWRLGTLQKQAAKGHKTSRGTTTAAAKHMGE